MMLPLIPGSPVIVQDEIIFDKANIIRKQRATAQTRHKTSQSAEKTQSSRDTPNETPFNLLGLLINHYEITQINFSPKKKAQSCLRGATGTILPDLKPLKSAYICCLAGK